MNVYSVNVKVSSSVPSVYVIISTGSTTNMLHCISKGSLHTCTSVCDVLGSHTMSYSINWNVQVYCCVDGIPKVESGDELHNHM